MKYTQTDTQFVIKQSGIGQLAIGVVLIVAGLGVAGFGLTTKNSKVPLLVGAVLALVGIVLLLLARSLQTTITKGGQTQTLSTRLIGGKSSTHDFPTANIKSVRLRTYLQASSATPGQDPASQRRSDMQLVLQDGALVTVASSGGGGLAVNGIGINNFMKAPLHDQAQKLADFLGVSLDVEDSSTLLGATKSIENAVVNAYQANHPDADTPATGAAQAPGPLVAGGQSPVSPAAPAATTPADAQPPVDDTQSPTVHTG